MPERGRGGARWGPWHKEEGCKAWWLQAGGIVSKLPPRPLLSPLLAARYETTETAIAVHQSLQGAVIPSSDRGGMRIQYSKNPFGIKRGGA